MYRWLRVTKSDTGPVGRQHEQGAKATIMSTSEKKSRLHWWILLGLAAGVVVGSIVHYSNVNQARRLVVEEATILEDAQLAVVGPDPDPAVLAASRLEIETTAKQIRTARRDAILEEARAAVVGADRSPEALTKNAAAIDARIEELEAARLASIDLEAHTDLLRERAGDVDEQLLALLNPTATYQAFDGIARLFLNLLKMIVIPLVFFSLVGGILGMGDVSRLGRVGVKTFGFYIATSLLAIVTGLLLVNLISPGSGLTLTIPSEAHGDPQIPESFWDVLVGMVPTSVVQAAAEFELIGVIVFTIFFGVFLLTLEEARRRPMAELMDIGFEVMTRMTRAIISLAPVGIGALVARLISTTGPGVFLNLFWYVATVLCALGIHLLVVLPLLIYLLTRRNPYRYFRIMSPAMFTAFSTASSSGTLGITMERAEKGAGISNRVASFVLPLGATINMDGTALYEIVSVLFIAQVHETIDPAFVLTFQHQLLIVFLGLTVSIGAAGIPHAGLVMMVIILNAVGLPVEYTAIIWTVDRVLDMCRTAINVMSDSSIALIIAHTEGEVDDSVMESA